MTWLERYEITTYVVVDGKLVGTVESAKSATTQYIAKLRAAQLSKIPGYAKVEAFDRMARHGCKQLWRYVNGALEEESYREAKR